MGQAPAGQQEAASPISGFLPLILIFFVFYFLLIRPQKKQVQQQKDMINKLKRGDEIVTSGGIHGKVTALKGKQVELEISPNTRIILNKQAVSYLKTQQTAEESGE